MPLIRKPNFPVAKRGKVFKKLKNQCGSFGKFMQRREEMAQLSSFFPEAQPFSKKNNLWEGEERRSVLLPTLKGEKWAQSQSLFGIVAEEEEEERQKIEVTCIRQAGGEKD